MSNIFIQFENQKLSQITYYRLLLPILVPYERIIYLDNDVLVFKDLLELYQTSFNNNYVLGSLDLSFKIHHHLCQNSDRYINAGILLLNLDKIKINICINLNNAHIYIALVAMESALSNLNKEKSIYVYHILCGNDIDYKNIEKIRNLTNK